MFYAREEWHNGKNFTVLQFHEFVIDINILWALSLKPPQETKFLVGPGYFLVGLTSDRGRDLMMVIFQPSVAELTLLSLGGGFQVR